MNKFAPDRIALFLLIAILAPTAFAADGNSQTPYAGQQKRTIKSLSAGDIQALREGRGWGFAKPAELNGYPGPLHVLEFDKKLGLSDVQRTRIKSIYEAMKTEAIQVGHDFLRAEQALDNAFANNTATPARITELTQLAARQRAKLQTVHLKAHLLTTPLLSKAQLHRYATLRGYAGNAHRSPEKSDHKGSHGGH